MTSGQAAGRTAAAAAKRARTAQAATVVATAEIARVTPGLDEDFQFQLARRIVEGLFAARERHDLGWLRHINIPRHWQWLRENISPDGINDPTAVLGYLGFQQVAQAAADVIVASYARAARGSNPARRAD